MSVPRVSGGALFDPAELRGNPIIVPELLSPSHDVLKKTADLFCIYASVALQPSSLRIRFD